MNQQETGRFIAEKRRAKNLTQEQLAEMIGVSNKTVSKWETGKCMPDYSVVERLCKVLGISVGELLAAKETDGSRSFSEEDIELLLYKMEELEKKKGLRFNSSMDKTVKTGITMGSALAMIISYTTWRSIGWAIFHGLMSWGYVVYFLIRY